AIAAIADPLERLAVETSHPQWLLQNWVDDFGETTARELALANNQTPPVAFRINTLKADVEETVAAVEADGLQLRRSTITRGAYVVESGSAAALARFSEAGAIYIQDEASQLVALLLAAEPDSRVLDLCAAPGSKTSHIAALTGNRAAIVACDLYAHRIAT